MKRMQLLLMVIATLIISCNSLFAQRWQSSPTAVVERLYDLRIAMIPANFEGSAQELKDLQTELIDQSLELICDKSIPLSEDKSNVATSIKEGDFVVNVETFRMMTHRIEERFGMVEWYKRYHVTFGWQTHGEVINEWAGWWSEKITHTEIIETTRIDSIYTSIIQATSEFIDDARDTYRKSLEVAIFYGTSVSGINIINHALIYNGAQAVVEAYIGDAQNTQGSQYILVKKIGGKWYVDRSKICFKKELSGASLELQKAVELYKEIASSRELKPTDTLLVSDENPEKFIEFIELFYKDPDFQLTRVKFPIGMTYDWFEDKRTPYTEQTWENISGIGATKISETIYGGEWVTDGGASGGEIQFELGDDNLWYLVKYNTY